MRTVRRLALVVAALCWIVSPTALAGPPTEPAVPTATPPASPAATPPATPNKLRRTAEAVVALMAGTR